MATGETRLVGPDDADLVITRDDPLHEYRIQAPAEDALGRRAAKRRQDRGMTVEQLAARAGVDARDVAAFESSGTGTVATMVALHVVLSKDQALEDLFTTPRSCRAAMAERVQHARRRVYRRPDARRTGGRPSPPQDGDRFEIRLRPDLPMVLATAVAGRPLSGVTSHPVLNRFDIAITGVTAHQRSIRLHVTGTDPWVRRQFAGGSDARREVN